MEARLEMTSINYPGTPAGLADMLGGRMHAIMDGLPSLAGAIDGGKLKLIAVGSAKRLPNRPEHADGRRDAARHQARARLVRADGAARHAGADRQQDQRRICARCWSEPELKKRFEDIASYTQADDACGNASPTSASEQELWKPVIAQDRHEGEMTMRAMQSSVRCIALAMVLAAPARAQDAYPSKPITMIVPFAAGGSTDVIGRVIAEGLRQVLGQTVVVDNRGGAGGSIGTAAIARAQPDGYTIGMGTASTLAINPAAYKSLPFDVLTDLSPIGNIAAVPNIMTIHPVVAAADMAAFIALARAQPGKLSYASAGHRLGEPSARRAVQAGDRHRPPARAVSRRRDRRSTTRSAARSR